MTSVRTVDVHPERISLSTITSRAILGIGMSCTAGPTTPEHVSYLSFRVLIRPDALSILMTRSVCTVVLTSLRATTLDSFALSRRPSEAFSNTKLVCLLSALPIDHRAAYGSRSASEATMRCSRVTNPSNGALDAGDAPTLPLIASLPACLRSPLSINKRRRFLGATPSN